MKFDAEICEGVSCLECPFNREDGCLLAKRLDEIEIIKEPCEDAVPRTSVEYICRKNTVSTNPYEHKYHDKFMQFMDDPEISDFGRWQHSNGFNTALVAVKCDLEKVPSAQPEHKKGKWILHREHERIVYDIPPEGPEPPYHRKITPTYKCSVCGFISFDYAPNFCEECGADMREAP